MHAVNYTVMFDEEAVDSTRVLANTRFSWSFSSGDPVQCTSAMHAVNYTVMFDEEAVDSTRVLAGTYFLAIAPEKGWFPCPYSTTKTWMTCHFRRYTSSICGKS
ncbi:hypothetical protein MTO96_015855 [Rhipicephalus appendiculatus]